MFPKGEFMVKKENIPNLLTVVRILMIPLFIVLTSVTTSTTWHSCSYCICYCKLDRLPRRLSST